MKELKSDGAPARYVQLYLFRTHNVKAVKIIYIAYAVG